MFFKKYRYQRQLKEALKLLERASRLTAPYLYEKGYHPTRVELEAFQALRRAHGLGQAYTKHVLADLWGHKEWP